MNKDFDDAMKAIGLLACIAVQAKKLYKETNDEKYNRTAKQVEKLTNSMIKAALMMKRDEIMKFFIQRSN